VSIFFAVGYEKLENECESLHGVVETLKQEKAESKKLGKLKLLRFTLGFRIIV
jgi:hypothetical protein